MNPPRSVSVKTFAGWGWADTQETGWDFVPAPFEADVTLGSELWYEELVPTLRGIVTRSDGLTGFTVLLSPRHQPWDGDVNVTLESKDGRKLKGFGSIDMKSFS